MIDSVMDRLITYEEYQDNPVGLCEEVFSEEYTDDCKAIIESVWKYPVTIGKSANGVGKTYVAARIAAAFFKIHKESQVYTAATPLSNLKKLLWGEIGFLVDKNPKFFSEFKQKVLHLERNSKSFLTGVTIPVSGDPAIRQAKFSGKHAPFLLFIIDEGDTIQDEVYRGIESCMSGGHARLLILFNPRNESGPVYRMIRDGIANVVTLSAFSHPNVVTGEDKIPGAVDRETTARRINQWSRPIKPGEAVDAASCFDLPEFLVGVVAKSQSGIPYPPLEPGRRKITDPAFSHMVLGRYPAQSVNALISKEWISAARARWDAYVVKFGEVPPRNSSAAMGIDVAVMGNDLNKVCFRYGGYVAPLLEWGGVDTLVTGDMASIEYHKNNVRGAAVDGNGVGTGVAPHMRRLGCNAHDILVQESATERIELGKFRILRDQLLWSVREWLRIDSGAMLPPDDMLEEELLVLTYWLNDRGKVEIMKRETIVEKLQRSPDAVSALMMTFAKIEDAASPYIHKEIEQVRFVF